MRATPSEGETPRHHQETQSIVARFSPYGSLGLGLVFPHHKFNIAVPFGENLYSVLIHNFRLHFKHLPGFSGRNLQFLRLQVVLH